jgi:hypothetical protein
MGHTIDKCDRDPNLKHGEDGHLEIERISKIKQFRKLHAEGAVLTTRLLKKCVMLPLEYDGNDEEKIIPKNKKDQAFMRGAMMFEDYNYD